jgi:hypothetical protein
MTGHTGPFGTLFDWVADLASLPSPHGTLVGLAPLLTGRREVLLGDLGAENFLMRSRHHRGPHPLPLGPADSLGRLFFPPAHDPLPATLF